MSSWGGRYISNMETTLHAGLTMAELQELATATYNMVEKMRRKLAAQGKMVWLNGVDNADPFVLTYEVPLRTSVVGRLTGILIHCESGTK